MPPKKRKFDAVSPVIEESKDRFKQNKKRTLQSNATELFQAGSSYSSSKYDDSMTEKVSQAYNEIVEASRNKKDIEIPDSINLLQFAECRATEIATVMQEVTQKRRKLSLQQLPNHMRRRAASHDLKRVPRRLREKALKEIQKAKKSKRPSRRHRRRPKNLLAEYNRRQREFVWLETHIWFAKRFKMDQLWGYRIPLHPNDKNVRASFKATAHGLLIQDLSYFCCVELAGPQALLLSRLCLLTNTDVGLTFAAKLSLQGSREGHTFLYQPHSYPYRAIGPVSFLWQPMLESSSVHDISEPKCEIIHKLWIWCHPSIHNEVVEVMITLFDLKEIQTDIRESNGLVAKPSILQVIDNQESKLPSTEESTVSNDVLKNIKIDDLPSISKDKALPIDTSVKEAVRGSITKEPIKTPPAKSFPFTSNITLMKTKLRFQVTPCYQNDNVKMTLLKDNLVRHRLIGPMALSVVTDALKVADVNSSEEHISIRKKWWEVYYEEDERKSLHFEKQHIWNQLKGFHTYDMFPPKTVIGLTVKDPRLNLPEVKSAVATDKEDIPIEEAGEAGAMPSLFTASIASSALWEKDIRDQVTATKKAESEINKIRSQFLVTERVLDLGRNESRVPVIAIHQPGIGGYASGWDIIAPLGWSMPFWIAFIFRKAHAAGLRELKSLHKELQQPLIPYNFPDTQSGVQFDRTEWQQKMTKHYRYPPDKRPSFQKLGVLSPYFMPWSILVDDWKRIMDEDVVHSFSASAANPQSLAVDNMEGNNESNSDLTKICDFFVLRNKKPIKLLKEVCDTVRAQKFNQKEPRSCLKLFNEFLSSIEEPTSNLKHSLILVQIKNLCKGIPYKYSGIYLLDKSDIDIIKTNPRNFELMEPIHKVTKIKKVKKKRKSKLVKEPVKEKEPIKSRNSRKVKIMKPHDTEIKLEKPKIETLLSECNRKMIGFVNEGAYSFRGGYGCGIGHCTLIGFLQVLKVCLNHRMQPVVLIRSQNSLQYRVCEIDIIENVY